eukprot:scaffold1855_cov143-Isochrysis_galbana.AAC.3
MPEDREPNGPDMPHADTRTPLHGPTGGVPSDKALSDTYIFLGFAYRWSRPGPRVEWGELFVVVELIEVGDDESPCYHV